MAYTCSSVEYKYVPREMWICEHYCHMTWILDAGSSGLALPSWTSHFTLTLCLSSPSSKWVPVKLLGPAGVCNQTFGNQTQLNTNRSIGFGNLENIIELTRTTRQSNTIERSINCWTVSNRTQSNHNRKFIYMYLLTVEKVDYSCESQQNLTGFGSIGSIIKHTQN